MKKSWQRCVLVVVSFLAGWFMTSAPCQQTDSGQSLGDLARKLRKDTTNEVKMTDADTKKLFASVDRIFAFAAEDTSMPKRAAVKRLGFLPRDFNLKEFLVKSTGQQIAAYYDDESKTISLAVLGAFRPAGADSGPRTDACPAGSELRFGEVDEGCPQT